MESKVSRRRVRQMERRRQAWQLRIQGKSETEIARILGVAQSTISEDLRIAFPEYQKINDQAREQFIKWHISRVEYYLDCLDKKIKEGDEKAVLAALKILQHEASLIGVTVSVPQVDVHVTNINDPDELRSRLKAAIEERCAKHSGEATDL